VRLLHGRQDRNSRAERKSRLSAPVFSPTAGMMVRSQAALALRRSYSTAGDGQALKPGKNIFLDSRVF
jgi:hypothetical protein